MRKASVKFTARIAKAVLSIEKYMNVETDYRDKRGLKHELWVVLVLFLLGLLNRKTSMVPHRMSFKDERKTATKDSSSVWCKNG